MAASEEAGAENAASPITLVLADDHAVVRSALRMLLDAEQDMEVLAEAGDVESTIRYVRGHRPDVLVLDLNMPGGPSIRSVDRISEASPDTKVVILTMQAETAFAREAMQAGVQGYILKEAADSELVKAVRLAAESRTYLQPELGARLAAEQGQPRHALSDRETEILRLVALGYTNGEIAAELFLSVRTVESHRSHLQRKLGMSKRSELVRYALRNGLVRDEEGSEA
ncbi:response regulator transcription factor [Thermoleophilia bacterium SCSIO 60948]|nr:response regulator transcription factor [Thermoleophilia bacterium SCSIO 60948]